jgi:hypothetical protein
LLLSQPAVSRALQRLRATFHDDLLIRTGSGRTSAAGVVYNAPAPRPVPEWRRIVGQATSASAFLAACRRYLTRGWRPLAPSGAVRFGFPTSALPSDVSQARRCCSRDPEPSDSDRSGGGESAQFQSGRARPVHLALVSLLHGEGLGLVSQLGSVEYARPRKFREKLEGWLDLVRTMWPQCPAAIDANGTGLFVDRANAIIPPPRQEG